MANCCSDSVVFYSFDNNEAVKKFAEDIENYFEPRKLSECWFGGFLSEKGIDVSGFSIRGTLIYYEAEETNVLIDVESAWHPLLEAYKVLAKLYNLNFVVKAEEPGFEIYINTDVEGNFFAERYVAHVSDFNSKNSITLLF